LKDLSISRENFTNNILLYSLYPCEYTIEIYNVKKKTLSKFLSRHSHFRIIMFYNISHRKRWKVVISIVYAHFAQHFWLQPSSSFRAPTLFDTFSRLLRHAGLILQQWYSSRCRHCTAVLCTHIMMYIYNKMFMKFTRLINLFSHLKYFRLH